MFMNIQVWRRKGMTHMCTNMCHRMSAPVTQRRTVWPKRQGKQVGSSFALWTGAHSQPERGDNHLLDSADRQLICPGPLHSWLAGQRERGTARICRSLRKRLRKQESERDCHKCPCVASDVLASEYLCRHRILAFSRDFDALLHGRMSRQLDDDDEENAEKWKRQNILEVVLFFVLWNSLGLVFDFVTAVIWAPVVITVRLNVDGGGEAKVLCCWHLVSRQ